MRKIGLLLLLLAINFSLQAQMPQRLQQRLTQFTQRIDQLNDSKTIEQRLNKFMASAPNQRAKQGALRFISQHSKSEKVKAAVQKFRNNKKGNITQKAKPQKVNIPDVADIYRVKPGEKMNLKSSPNYEFIFATQQHPVSGNSYVIITDQTEKGFVEPLKKLAKFRDASIINVKNMAQLYNDAAEIERVKQALIRKKAKYVAIAPRVSSYSENMLLSVLEVLTQLDDDALVDVYPGVLYASTPTTFAQLIDRSINYKTITKSELKPMSICMIPNNSELRSWQKNMIMQKMFAKDGYNIPILNIYNSKVTQKPLLPKNYNGDFETLRFTNKKYIKKLPKKIENQIQQSNFITYFGHGLPGVSCGLDKSSLPEKLNTKVMLLGSCFSASSETPDINTRKSPDGKTVKVGKSYGIQAVDNGATVVLGHIRTNQGFPVVFPVVEAFLKGETVGKAYQELLNTSIQSRNLDTKNLAFRTTPKNPRNIPQNVMLYIIFGDPAIVPLQAM